MSLMIDWITCVVPVKHSHVISGGYLFHNRHGEVVREGLTTTTVIGSHSASVQVKTNQLSECGNHGTELYINGNPAKFLQGHNVCGSLNLARLMELMLERIMGFFDSELDPFSRARLLQGDYVVHRVDINAAYELPCHSDVKAWIGAASVQSRTRHGRPELKKNTLYWGKGSTLWMLKAYSKFTELTSAGKKRSLPPEFVNTPLLGYTRNKLRIELQLRKELHKIAKRDYGEKYFKAKFLTPEKCAEFFFEYLGRVNMNSTFGQKTFDDLLLPPAARATFMHWKQGLDLNSIYTQSTLYRHRSKIKKVLDVDIFVPYSGNQEANNVIPLLRPLEAKPAVLDSELLQYMVI